MPVEKRRRECYKQSTPGLMDCEWRRCSAQLPCATRGKMLAIGAGSAAGGVGAAASGVFYGVATELLPAAAGAGMVGGMLATAVGIPNSETEGYCQCFTQHG
eukprot:TRINITY_DN37280_c0_g1_i1.p2 TRINITY_DN37280_c0_g1~~TRINITY_DN37280_c0_g1_i1.p2  ORF type:complete len:102 (+),score=16.70 TRINITY_DN37280_c0_g1_i1:47-352(+)